MFSIFKKYFAFGAVFAPYLRRGLLFTLLRSFFEGFQVTALWIVLSALVHKTLSPTTAIVAAAIMAFSICGAAIMAHLSSQNFCHANYSMAGYKRAEVADHLRKLPMGFFNDKNLGEVTTLVTNDLDIMQNLGGLAYQMILGGMSFSLIICLSMCVLDWRLGALSFGTLVLFSITIEALQGYVRSFAQRQVKAQRTIVNAVLEYVQGISVVRAFSLVDDAQSHLACAIDECEKTLVQLEYAGIRFALLQACIAKGASLVVCLLSCYKLLFEAADPAICLTLIAASFMLFSRLEMSGMFSTALRSLDAIMDRVNATLATKAMPEGDKMLKAGVSAATSAAALATPNPHALDIAVRNVNFSYDTHQILHDVSLSIPAGTSCALVGPSGSGKTTLVRLLQRFWDVDAGSITIGGHDIREYQIESLMLNFSTVFQSVFLFDDTIENNIAFGTPAATHEQVVAAARRACCEEFIKQLPDGYQTKLGENGALLSGGQRQRISIARAMLRDAPIVVLDEATANVDPENELELQKAIVELTKHKTVIMIAHRLKTIMHADQILVVDAGRIVQRGTHSELVAQKGLYADFIQARQKAAGWKLAKV
ncbi:ABC transporter ATP-binding protein [Atopobium deltae]|uniref:ABC transporter, ATP-binding protein n=1 Tax=Atopobium deltae TaxID=1393034 RepID=A0A133XW44_9ACTN|nr:ABC transporter ATP-binding protein [Atopobium deltae]KXB35159.1 ABC transporter, ATP-binding protein [Atopobium deltae]